MFSVAIAGYGFMGRMHYRCWNSLPDAHVVAICDKNPDTSDDISKAIGNIPGAAQTVDLSRLRIYHDFEKMLAEERLDVLSLTLPTDLHADFSIKALNAGVNVLCEKPMALNTAECDRMIDAAQSTGKLLQIGHCLRFWPEYAEARRVVAEGRYGNIIAATFQRLTAAPVWSSDNWLMDEARSGGMLLDLHIHDTDFVQHLFGMPRAVRSCAARGANGRVVHIVSRYLYDDKLITAEGSWAMTPSFGFEMSFNIMLEKAAIVYDCTRQPTLRICPADRDAFTPQLEKTDGYFLEIAHFAKKLRGQKVPEVITIEQSRESVRIIEAEQESIETGRQVSLQ